MGEGEVEAVVRHFVELKCPPHLEAESAADEQEGNVVQSMGIALAQLVGPDDEGVVQEMACSTRFRSSGELLGEIPQLATKPFIDLHQFGLGGFIFIRLVG